MEVRELEAALKTFLQVELLRLQKLEDYYVGKHDILKKQDRVPGKKDTKLVNNYCEYIASISTAYFLGEPIGYACENENTDYEKLSEYLATEEEQQENFEHAQNCSIFGKSYELWYVDLDQSIKNVVLDPRDVFILRDNSIQKKMIAAVRWDMQKNAEDKSIYTLEVYDEKSVTRYEWEAEGKELPTVVEESKLHGFNQVPIIEFSNNKRQRGDFEGVITLIDGYNEVTSTSVDDMKDFTDAILVLKNLSGTDEETMRNVKRDKVMKTDGDGGAEWLVKVVNDTYAQNNKNRLNQDIHKFSLIPDMQDKEFSGNSSGVALGYKLLALEQLTAQKEMYFKKALNQRLQLMIDFYNLNLEPKQIQKVFTRNTPKNLVEIADVVTKLSGIVSQETLLSNIPFVEEAKTEMEKLKAEQEASVAVDMNTRLGADGNGEDE